MHLRFGKFNVQERASHPDSEILHQHISSFSRFGKFFAYDKVITPKFPILFPDKFSDRTFDKCSH
jgi:hypothetical protein